jgi:hypothetical protein
MTGLFITDNAEFFAESKKQTDQGYTWEYVGKRNADEFSFSLPVINETTGEKSIYWKLTAPEEK